MVRLYHGVNTYASLNAVWQDSNQNQGLISIDGSSIRSVQDIYQNEMNLSLFEDKKTILFKRLLQNPGLLKLTKEIVNFINSASADTPDLYFWEDMDLSKPSSSQKKIISVITSKGKVINYKAKSQSELANWTAGKCLSEGIKITPPQANSFVSIIGQDMDEIAGEIDKLCLYIRSDNRNYCLDSDLQYIKEKDPEYKIWDLTDAIFSKNKQKATSVLESLLVKAEDYPYLISSISEQLKIIFIVSSFSQKEINEAVKAFRIKPYSLIKAKSFARNFNIRQIKKIFSKLVELDYTVKQGKIDPKLGLDLLIYCL